MTGSLALACLWLVVANLTAMFPSRHRHWPAAYGLIAIGLPLLGWVVAENGWLLGFLVLVAAASVLRWPVYFLLCWLRALVSRGG